MFFMDVPTTSFQETTQSSTITTASQAVEKIDRTIGICHLEKSGNTLSELDGMSPVLDLKNYYLSKEKTTIRGDGIVTVLKMPTNGILNSEGGGNFSYLPNKGFIGNDRATLLVKIGGKQVKMEYFFRVVQSVPLQYETGPSPYEESGCPKKVRVWKMSSVADGGEIVVASELHSIDSNLELQNFPSHLNWSE
ncbi:hypothetical protein ACO0K9_02275 [Undibacterium sp. Ji50W]|uniref:hypothetical protein n=1 Tax=Undibacterium sp. Ji50W TaxID=3413041 RepID=UPI003BF0EF0A